IRHLARRLLWRFHRNWGIYWWHGSSRWIQPVHVSCRGGISLQDLDQAKNDQNDRPAMSPIQTADVGEQPKDTDGHQHGGTDHATRLAAVALTAAQPRRDQSPLAGEHPKAQGNQEQWPNAVKIELQRGVEKKQRAEDDQDDRARWHFSPPGLPSWNRPERLPEAEGIRRWLSGDYGMRRADWVLELVV